MKKKSKQPITQRKSIKDTQKLISKFHTLNKKLSQSKKLGDADTIEKINKEIYELGGLDTYQRASLKGGNMDKGWGSAGKWLVDKLKQLALVRPHMKMLDVGAISGEVYVKYNFLKVTSIDLNSQSPSVTKQDFFLRPIPQSVEDKFDIVCLSLVINFVPEAIDRGRMLKLVSQHLLEHGLFYLVLPLPCVVNSRYCTNDHLKKIIYSLGYSLIVEHHSKKLAYYLFKLEGEVKEEAFKKVEIAPGPARNNFCITME
ncbi:hypothetical protein HDV06_003297 [Boothiomyces sp. JEL0866]|nr:hypothetical protein HDV06_003297 [Boothiomyces sp. JEL0866]